MPQPLQRFNGLLGRMIPQENYGGLLSPQDQRAAANAYRAQLASGLLSAAGPQRMPVSLGQALGMAVPQAMQARDYRAETGLRNDQLRRQIDNENRQTAVRTKFSGLLRGAGGPDGELLGLLAELDPGLAMQALSGGNDRADPNVIRALTMAGIDPQSPEGQAIVIKSLTGGNDELAGIQAEIAALNAKGLAREQANAEREEQEEFATQEVAVNRSLEQTKKLSDLAKKLQGTLVQVGAPLGDWRRTLGGVAAGVGNVFGIDTEALTADLTAFDELKKGLSDQLINLMASGQLGEGTNSKLQQYQDALAKPETQLGAVLEIQANIARDLLDAGSVRGFSIRDRDQYEAHIKEWRDYEGDSDAPTIRAADIGRMDLEQIKQLDIEALNDEQRSALAKRLDDLGL